MNDRPRRLIQALPCLVLAVCFCLTVGFYVRYGAHNLDADMSSEMVFARLLNDERALISANWHYSSELRIVSPVPLFQLGLLLFPGNWQAARALATVLMLAGIVLSFLYFARKARLGRVGVYMAALLALPFSETYAYVGFTNGGYSVYLMLLFVLLGLILSIDAPRARMPRLVLIALLSLWGGLGGVRMMLFLAVPLVGAYAVELFDAMRRGERLRAEPALLLPAGASLLSAVCIFIGYVVNEKVLGRCFSYVRYGDMPLLSPSADLVFAQLTGIAEFFGLRESTRLISVRGVASLAALGMMGLCALGALSLLRRRREGTLDLRRRVLLLFTLLSVALGVLFNVVTGNYFSRYYLPGLLLLAMLPAFAFDQAECRLPLLKEAVPLALVAVFALEAAVYVRQEQTATPAPYEEAAQWLTDNGYTHGFATFWNASPLTEASDGAIKVFTMPDPYWQDDYQRLEMNEFLQSRDVVDRVSAYRAGRPDGLTARDAGLWDGPVFVLLGADDLRSGVVYADDARLAAALSAGNIYLYESIDALFDTLDASDLADPIIQSQGGN